VELIPWTPHQDVVTVAGTDEEDSPGAQCAIADVMSGKVCHIILHAHLM